MENEANDSAVDPANAGEAGALGCKEIEVTPEMIEAGTDAILSRYLALTHAEEIGEIVKTVFLAMEANRKTL